MDAESSSAAHEVVRYPARFVDRLGEAEALFETDGRGLTVSFRGLEFSTTDHSNILWSLRLQGDAASADGRAVVNAEDELRGGTLEVGLRLDAVIGANTRLAVLRTTITFTDDDARFIFSLLLELDGKSYGPVAAGEEFEAALDRLRTVLPPNVRLRMCGTCLLSSNGISNNFSLGRNCYRANPAEALAACGKRPAPTEVVADFYVCPQWIPSEVRTWLRATFDDPTAHGPTSDPE